MGIGLPQINDSVFSKAPQYTVGLKPTGVDCEQPNSRTAVLALIIRFLIWSILIHVFFYNVTPREFPLSYIQAQSSGAPHRVKAEWRTVGLSDIWQCLPCQLEKQHKQTMKFCFSSAWGLLVGCHEIVSLLESVYLLGKGPGNAKGTRSYSLEPSHTRTSGIEQPDFQLPGWPAVLPGFPGLVRADSCFW